MRNSALKFVVACALCTCATIGVSPAAECKVMDTEAILAKLMKKHEGSKVLKVEEKLDSKGCTELKVRILIDGTVKAITVANKSGA